MSYVSLFLLVLLCPVMTLIMLLLTKQVKALRTSPNLHFGENNVRNSQVCRNSKEPCKERSVALCDCGETDKTLLSGEKPNYRTVSIICLKVFLRLLLNCPRSIKSYLISQLFPKEKECHCGQQQLIDSPCEPFEFSLAHLYFSFIGLLKIIVMFLCVFFF